MGGGGGGGGRGSKLFLFSVDFLSEKRKTILIELID